MADDNKQAINPNTNDDLNIDFDIVLDQSEDFNQAKEDSKPNIQKSDSDLNFNLNPEPQINKQEIEVPIQETQQATIIPEVKIEENPIVQEIETINTETPAEPGYNPDLKSINETIQQLQEAKQQWKQTITSNKLDEIATTPTINAKIIQQETQTTNTIPTWTINLDEILPTSEIKTQSPIQDIPQVPFPQWLQQATNPYDIAPQTTTKINKDWHKKHLIMVIWIVAACLIAWFFILKTMYPMQFGINDWWSWNNTDTTQETNPFQETTPSPIQEIVSTGEVLEDTWIDQSINELTWNILDISWDIQDHNITDQTDPFQDLDNLQTSDEQKKQATIELLKEFVTKWQYYLDLWKEKKISDMMKFWAFLTNKSTTFINQIENWEILDISSIDWYLAQSSWYLQTLQELENASNTTPKPQEETGFTSNQTWTQDTGENTQL